MNLELGPDFGRAFAPDRFDVGVARAPYPCGGAYNAPDGIENSHGVLDLAAPLAGRRK